MFNPQHEMHQPKTGFLKHPKNKFFVAFLQVKNLKEEMKKECCIFFFQYLLETIRRKIYVKETKTIFYFKKRNFNLNGKRILTTRSVIFSICPREGNFFFF